jgi:glycosyltransferase involved in cell wall biosynthesis
MAEALTRRGHEIHVVAYHLGDMTQPLPFAVHRIGGSGYARTAPGPTWHKFLQLDPQLVRVLGRVLRERDFALIHAHHYEGLLAALLRTHGRSLPLVFDAHTLLESELPYYALGLPTAVKAAIGRTLDRCLPPRADRVIAVTDDMRTALVGLGQIASHRISVIPNGVEYQHFAAPVDELRREPTQPRVTFAGSLAPYQGIDVLLEAFALMRARRKDVRLQLLTESDFSVYTRRAEALGVRASIDILNPDFATLPRYLQNAEVLLNPRPACNGIPQKLLNYMATGRPIVSYAGSAKLIEHGRSALVVADGDVQAFADATLHLLASPELGRELGANARRLVEAQYSWDRTAARVESVYEEVLGERGRSASI